MSLGPFFASREAACMGIAVTAATIGAFYDVRTRRIPNTLTGGSLLFGLFLHGWLGGAGEMATAGAGGILVGVGFLFFYLAGGMGAGDVKLMAAVGCLAGFAAMRLWLPATVVSGAVIALGIALCHRCARCTIASTVVRMNRALHLRSAGESPELPETGESAIAGERVKAGEAGRLTMPYAVPIACGCWFALIAEVWKG